MTLLPEMHPPSPKFLKPSRIPIMHQSMSNTDQHRVWRSPSAEHKTACGQRGYLRYRASAHISDVIAMAVGSYESIKLKALCLLYKGFVDRFRLYLNFNPNTPFILFWSLHLSYSIVTRWGTRKRQRVL